MRPTLMRPRRGGGFFHRMSFFYLATGSGGAAQVLPPRPVIVAWHPLREVG
jgi:hypothetical protein